MCHVKKITRLYIDESIKNEYEYPKNNGGRRLEWPFRCSELPSLSILVRLSRASLIDLTTIDRRLTK